MALFSSMCIGKMIVQVVDTTLNIILNNNAITKRMKAWPRGGGGGYVLSYSFFLSLVGHIIGLRVAGNSMQLPQSQSILNMQQHQGGAWNVHTKWRPRFHLRRNQRIGGFALSFLQFGIKARSWAAWWKDVALNWVRFSTFRGFYAF